MSPCGAAATSIMICAVGLCFGDALPLALGVNLLRTGPLSTLAEVIIASSGSKPALATADAITFEIIPAALFGVNYNEAIAYSAFIP